MTMKRIAILIALFASLPAYAANPWRAPSLDELYRIYAAANGGYAAIPGLPTLMGGMLVSSDGTGNPGTWEPLTGSGGTAINGLPTTFVGMLYSTDGTGNPGTWAYCTTTCGGGTTLTLTTTGTSGAATLSGGTLNIPVYSTSAAGTPVSVNGGSALSAANFNATTPTADASNVALTFKVDGSGNIILESPYGSSSTFGVLKTDGATLSVSSGVVSLNLAHANTWTGTQTFTAPALGTPASGVITNLTGTCTNCTANNAVEVNGAAVPTSAAVLGSNGSNQPIATTGHLLVAPIQCADTSSSATAYTCSTTPTLASLSTGDTFILTGINQVNTGSATLNIDTIGAKTIKKWQNASTLVGGDLQTGGTATMIYDGTNLELSTIGNPPATGGTITGQANGVIPLATGASTLGAQSHISDSGSALTATEPVTVSAGGSSSVTVGIAGSATGTAILNSVGGGSETLTPALTASNVTITIPAATDTLVNLAGTQTLTNKSIAASEVNSGTLAAAQMPALTGDVTSSAGSVATTVGKINGTALSGLASGPLYNTTSTGVPSITTPHQLVGPIQCLDTSSSATAYTCTTTPTMAALTNGDAFLFYGINQNNSGSSTLNIDGIGAKTLKKWQNTSNLAAGDLQAAGAIVVTYDGTALEVSAIGNAPGGSGTVTSVATTSPLTGGTITSSGTIACATCVTSAASLTNNAIMLGAGSQGSQTTTTGTGVVTALGDNTNATGGFPTVPVAISNVGTSGLSGTSPVAISSAGAISCATCIADGGTNLTTDGALYGTGPTTAASTTAPTTSGHTFALAWQPSGSAVAPAPLDLATYLASPPAIGGTSAAAGAFTTITGTSSATLGANGGTGGSLVLEGSTSGSATVNVSATGVLALPSGTTATNMALTTPGIGAATGTSLAATGGISGASWSLCADSSGSATAQSCTTTPATFTVAAGSCFTYTTTTTNSGTGLTINPNSLGNTNVAIPGASGWTTTLTASIIPANKPMLVCYDGTNLNVQQTGTAASGGGGGGSITGSGLTQYSVYNVTAAGLTLADAWGFSTAGSTVTISNASPAVITVTNNAYAGALVQFTTTGSLPTGLTAGTTYCVISSGLSTSQFEVASACGGSAINTSSAGSGTQTVFSVVNSPAVCIAATTTACNTSGNTVTDSSWSWTVGGMIYVSDGSSAGVLTQTQPTSSGHSIDPVGVALSTTQALLQPASYVLVIK